MTAARDWGWASLIKEDTCEPIMSSVVGAVNQLGTVVLPFRREVVPWQKRGFVSV